MFHNKAHMYFGQLLHEWVILSEFGRSKFWVVQINNKVTGFSYSGFGSSPFHEMMIWINLSYEVESDGNRNNLILGDICTIQLFLFFNSENFLRS